MDDHYTKLESADMAYERISRMTTPNLVREFKRLHVDLACGVKDDATYEAKHVRLDEVVAELRDRGVLD